MSLKLGDKAFIIFVLWVSIHCRSDWFSYLLFTLAVPTLKPYFVLEINAVLLELSVPNWRFLEPEKKGSHTSYSAKVSLSNVMPLTNLLFAPNLS